MTADMNPMQNHQLWNVGCGNRATDECAEACKTFLLQFRSEEKLKTSSLCLLYPFKCVDVAVAATAAASAVVVVICFISAN